MEVPTQGNPEAAQRTAPLGSEGELGATSRSDAALRPDNPAVEEWNDSLAGDYLWTNSNLGEAIPDVMTPCAWSLVQICMADSATVSEVEGHRLYGNIGGRYYMNLSLLATLAAAFGQSSLLDETNAQIFGRRPDDPEIPLIPISRWRILRSLIPAAVRMRREISRDIRRMPTFLANMPAQCAALRARIQAASTQQELADLWRIDLEPCFHECSFVLRAAVKQDGNALIKIRQDLRRLVGEADATALTTGGASGTREMASLGPLLGLAWLARGDIDRATFAREYGHRGTHEFEVSMPRPGEDPEWIDRQVAGLQEAPVDVDSLIARQQSERTAAWERFRQRRPGKEAEMRLRVDRWAAAARDREAARSEVIRVFWVLRDFVLRAGETTGRGDDLFFLSMDEILALLRGDRTPLERVCVRRATFQRYSSLPPYPSIIRGRFDPFKWAADPNRRSDLFDETREVAPVSLTIRGFPGAAGTVEGRARVIASVEEGEQLQAGEVLVTVVTNVGWTPLFPRALAVVTDVGAPLSHAAIVARELGIPAVVGCGNATMRLRTGDLVRVDGAKGTVEVLRQGDGPWATGVQKEPGTASRKEADE